MHTVVWKDSQEEWQVALDTSDMYELDSTEGRLEDFKPLGEFHIKQEYRAFSAEDACNYGVHVYSGGDVLSIFTGAGILPWSSIPQIVDTYAFCLTVLFI